MTIYISRITWYLQSFNFSDCLRRAFRRRVSNNKNYPNCATPWHQDMMGFKNYSKDTFNSCNQSEMEQQIQLDTVFIKHAAAYRLQEDCLGKNS